MGNTTVVSFKVAPRHHAMLRALASSRHMTLSEFLREAVAEALQLDEQADRFRALFEEDERAQLAGAD